MKTRLLILLTALLALWTALAPGVVVIDPYRFPAPGGAFTPSDISGLQLWLSDTGSDPSIWPDLSGHGRDATQATSAARPSLSTMAGHQARSFDGVDDYLRGTIDLAGSTVTAFAVFQMENSGGNYARILSVGVPGDNDYGSASYGGLIMRILLSSDIGGYRVSQLSTGSISYATPTVVASQFTGSTHTMFIDGTGHTPASSTGDFATSHYTVGMQMSLGDGMFQGKIAEVLIYDPALNSADRQAVEDYLGGKYGIPIASTGAPLKRYVSTSPAHPASRPLRSPVRRERTAVPILAHLQP